MVTRAARFGLFCICLVFLTQLSSDVYADDTLVSAGSTWKYLDDGSDGGTAWHDPNYDDSTWSVGGAQLGYGEDDEITVVGYGPDADSKFITTYFRLAFHLQNTTRYTGIKIRLLRDDGAVVYLNGHEIVRSNMPTGVIDYKTRASSAASDEKRFYTSPRNKQFLRTGTNIIAVEVHQSSSGSSDLSFDLELIGVTKEKSPTLTRGPYLQQSTSNSMVIRWRTDLESNSVVRFGSSPSNLTRRAINHRPTREHIVTLKKLSPSTLYYYSIGNSKKQLSGGNYDHFFMTAPPRGVAKPTRIWVMGDSGTGSSKAASVQRAYRQLTGNAITDLWLMLGDNAYLRGTDREYQIALFDIFRSMLKSVPLWLTPGNHESFSSDAAKQSGPYYDNFTLPKRGEAGGVPSGTEAYYSFDHGNIHFISLESHRTDRSENSPMLSWLRRDLRTTTADWLIAFWHHSPHSHGSNNSDTDHAMMEMRQNVLPILEKAGVDLVLGGHSHNYERSFLIDGHYGLSTSFKRSMILQGGSGREGSPQGVYTKRSTGLAGNEGTVYAVVGSSGQVTESGKLNHPAMYTSVRLHGSLVVEINGNRLDAVFIDKEGNIHDSFTIRKGVSAGPDALPASPTSLEASAVSSTQINLVWSDKSSNELGFKIERSTDGERFSDIATSGENQHSYADSSLQPSYRYHYRVRAYNSAGHSAYSNTVAESTMPGKDQVLAAPSNLKATGSSRNKIVLKWTDNSGNETGFKIERSTEGQTFEEIATTEGNSELYQDTGLPSKSRFYYRIRAFRLNDGTFQFQVIQTRWKPLPDKIPPFYRTYSSAVQKPG